MTPDLTQVLADARGELPILRKVGQHATAAYVEKLCDEIDAATESFRRFIPEPDAMLRSGHKAPWFRARFAQWERDGHAKRERGQRYYRLMIVPTRAQAGAARARGRKAAHEGTAA